MKNKSNPPENPLQDNGINFNKRAKKLMLSTPWAEKLWTMPNTSEEIDPEYAIESHKRLLNANINKKALNKKENMDLIINLKKLDNERAKQFIDARTALHKSYITEVEKTKRLMLILATILLLSACSIVLFAPEGRESLSYAISIALVLFSAGAVGFHRIWAKKKGISIGAEVANISPNKQAG